MTKRWQAICLCIAVVSLGLTLLLYRGSTAWLVPALVTYGLLAGIIYWRNQRVFLVPYTAPGGPKDVA